MINRMMFRTDLVYNQRPQFQGSNVAF